MRRLLLALSLLLSCLTAAAQSPSSPPAQHPAGRVELVEGDVTVYSRAKMPRRVAVGDRVHEGEGIVTGPDGELHLAMEDAGFIAVRPNTKMSITAYRSEGDEQDKSSFNLLQGTFRSITGWIGKFNPRSYQVRTPTSTIGVRGTDHEPLVIPQGATDGEPGSYDKVNAGATTLKTQHGSIEVRPNQAGFVPLSGRRPQPRVLSQVPAVFKATRHEPAIAVRHAAVSKVIDHRRDERRKAVKEQKIQLEKQKVERQKAVQGRRKEQEAQRQWQGEERRREWEAQREPRRQGHSVRQREERERRQSDGAERRPRFEDRQDRVRQERKSRSPEHDRGSRGGGRGRD